MAQEVRTGHLLHQIPSNTRIYSIFHLSFYISTLMDFLYVTACSSYFIFVSTYPGSVEEKEPAITEGPLPLSDQLSRIQLDFLTGLNTGE